MQISKHFKNRKHVGYKKTVGGRAFHLVYGTGPNDQQTAERIATALVAKWQQITLAGRREWTDAEIAECFALPTISPAPASERTLYGAIAEYQRWWLGQIGADGAGGENAASHRERIERAKEGIPDMPLSTLRRLAIDNWLAHFKKRPISRATGKPIGPMRIRNIASTIRHFLGACEGWEFWTPPPNWRRAFRGYTIKGLKSDEEKQRSRQPFPSHSPAEKHVLWHLALPYMKAMMGLADWCGHTQQEIATLVFKHIVEDHGEMYIDRYRHKTAVLGRWWVPPEVAVHVRAIVAKTPRDPERNPHQRAFLTARHLPLVHRNFSRKGQRSDYIGGQWETLLRAARLYGVRWVPFKYMRKGTAQLVRDRLNKDYAKLFCAHQLDDVQDESYTRPRHDDLEKCLRAIYEERRWYFGKLDWSSPAVLALRPEENVLV